MKVQGLFFLALSHLLAHLISWPEQGELSDDDSLVSVPLLQLAPKKPARQSKTCLDCSAAAAILSLNNREGKHFFYAIFDNGLLPSAVHSLILAQGELSDDDGLVSVPLQPVPNNPARWAKPRLDHLAVTTLSPNNRKGKPFSSMSKWLGLMPPILVANSDPFVNESSATEPDESVTEDDNYQDSDGEVIDVSDEGNNTIVNISYPIYLI